MKKKNWRQEHFIQTIKGGLVLKVMNIDSHGQPTLKFKSLKAICDSESMRKSTSDSDDDNLGSLTVKELREMSKTKKRKLSQSDKTSSRGCISSSKIDLTVEVNVEAVYEEKLSTLKMKLMSMKKTIAIAPSTFVKSSPVSFDESVVQGMYDQSFFQTVVDENGPFNTVIEAKELDHLNCQDVVHVSDCFAPVSYVYMGYGRECYDEMLEKANRNMLVIKESSHFLCKGISRCPYNDIPKNYLEPAGSSFSVYAADYFGESPNAYLSEAHKSLTSFVCENLEEASLTHSDPNRSPSEESLVTDELHFEKNASIRQETLCSNQVGYTVRQMLDMALNKSLQEPGLLYGGDASGPDKSGEDDKVYICDLKPDVVSEQLEEASTIGTVLYYSNNDDISATNELDSDKNASFQQGKSACHMDCDSVAKIDTLNNSLLCTELCYGIDEFVPDSDDEGGNENAKSDLKLIVAESISSTYIPDISTTDTPQPMELSDGGSGYNISVGNDGDTKKDISPELAATLTNIGDSVSSHDSYPSLSPSNVSDLRVNCPLTDEGELSLTANLSLFASDVNATLQGSSCVHSSEATNAVKYAETVEGCLREGKEFFPKRLLSTRMVISPTSQEKLCRGLNAGALCDNEETFSCREKLFVEDQSEKKNSLGVKTIPRQNVKKQIKNSKTGFSQLDPKGSLSTPSFSHRKPRTNTKFPSESTSAQKVITFSRRQMLDIQNVALDLMKQLKVMNAIVEETLLSEVGQPTSSKHSADEIQEALQDAARVERKTKRRLSIMTTDCTRFCKIVETAETKPSVPFGYEVHKKKKIRFADEDGGTLCHFYKDPQCVT